MALASKKQRRPDATTGRHILEKARTLTSTRGLGGLTVEDVLNAAEVSRRTFYLHFASIEDLLFRLYLGYMDEIVENVQRAAESDGTPLERVQGALDAWIEVQLRGGPLLAQLQAMSSQPDSKLFPYRERTLSKLCDAVGDGVRAFAGLNVDPWVWRAVFIGLEGLVVEATRGGAGKAKRMARLHAVAAPLFLGVLFNAPRLPQVQD